MIHIEENVNLQPYNTFGIKAIARYFCRISTEADLIELIHSNIYKSQRHLILGGGSNVLFTADFDGLIIKVDLKGISMHKETLDQVSLNVSSGEVWHSLVMFCVANNYGGIENLSLIPGTVGAAPIQNIGAYGVEVKEVIDEVHGIDLTTGVMRTFINAECQFGYRESIFKHALKEKIFISSVTLTLTRNNHRYNVSYGALAETIKTMHNNQINLQSISESVMHIRRSKLPDPIQLGNAGSFFKNPTVTLQHYESLKKRHPQIPGYHSENQYVKIPAGWLIEQCGWKGKRFERVVVHNQQEVVLVNYGNGSGKEILDLSQRIIESIHQTFNITLTPEVNIIQ